jgi:hypothetical protein
MSVPELLERVRAMTTRGADGAAYPVVLSPGLGEQEILELERRIAGPLPIDYRAALAHCGSFNCEYFEVDFAGRMMDFEGSGQLPGSVPFASDGCGNFWAIDLLPVQDQLAAVFFVCHDPPVVVFQCSGVATFLQWLIETSQSGGKTLSDFDQDVVFPVWDRDVGLLSRDDALAGDPALATFASSLDPKASVIDMRALTPGSGFRWSAFGLHTEHRRAAEDRIFAYWGPEKKVGFLERLRRKGRA